MAGIDYTSLAKCRERFSNADLTSNLEYNVKTIVLTLDWDQQSMLKLNGSIVKGTFVLIFYYWKQIYVECEIFIISFTIYRAS